ncbi:MAG: ATP-grasp domain-containing protein [Nitrososphaerota archaeon]|nr:ATP-grasp domain-containing protein [Nitrososphaerota archaeon]MDG6919119.1 ATP-grasp domain-containing protein [Nitrososphaerota archaeon]
MFDNVLIANRGEIAVRIIRTCKLLGVNTVAVYSDVDAEALHVRLADKAVRIGSADPGDSYLNIDKLVQAASDAGADALHPGYGFVSENWNLAEKCRQAGIKFIGPKPRTLVLAGNKVDCKRIAKGAGVPVIDGGESVFYTPEGVLEAARELGYPVLLKAAFGGGGRGIREASDDRQLLQAFGLATTEMKRSLGKTGLFVEKLVKPARHIEVQIVSDGRGKVIHLGERECSIQRRHQKLLEITPAPGLDELARMRVAEYAVSLAKALSYENVGTVEFLMDADQNFYFIEVNSRLQVEHPITEMRAGVDLVKEQLEIAAGEGIDYAQDDVELKGAAMQCRINAEDPGAGFAPSSGRIERLFFPGGAGVRVDTALYQGYIVPEYYDSLLAKLVVRGSDLEDARKRMALALSEFEIEGPKTTIPLQRFIVAHEEFAKWNLNVEFLQENRILESFSELIAATKAELAAQGAAIAAALLESGVAIGGARSGEPASKRHRLTQEGRHFDAL